MIVSENLDKEYATIAGVPAFTKASAQLAFGKDMNGLVSELHFTNVSATFKLYAVY